MIGERRPGVIVIVTGEAFTGSAEENIVDMADGTVCGTVCTFKRPGQVIRHIERGNPGIGCMTLFAILRIARRAMIR